MKYLLVALLALPPLVSAATPDQTAVALLKRDMEAERTGHARGRANLQRARALLTKPDQDADRQLIDDQLAFLDAHHASNMNDLLKRTMDLYGVYPSRRGGTVVVPGALHGSGASWSPRFGSGRRTRKVPLADGREIRLQTPGAYEAVTWVDGTVEFTEEAFQSPGYLATLLLHESVHFDQIVTPGRGDKISAWFSEKEAHSRSSSPQAALDYGLTPPEAARIKKVHTAQMHAFELVPDAAMMSMQFADPSDARAGAENDFAQDTAPQAWPAAPPAARSAPPDQPPAVSAPYAAPFTSRAPILAARVASEEVFLMAQSACNGRWDWAQSSLSEYPRLTEGDLNELLSRAHGSGCVPDLLRRLVEMRRNGEALNFSRLQTEVQAILNPPPVYDEPVERPSRSRGPCIKRGVYFPQC